MGQCQRINVQYQVLQNFDLSGGEQKDFFSSRVLLCMGQWQRNGCYPLIGASARGGALLRHVNDFDVIL
jgi:hypothetical protein